MDSKAALRRRLRAARATRGPSGPALLHVAQRELPELFAAPVVTAYSPLPDEPDMRPLIDALQARGAVVLLPVMRADKDLDWAGGGSIADASVLLIPALAVDLHGNRLGRGGGSYDRCLSRLGPGALRVAVVFDEEVLDEPLPVDPHDEKVHAALTQRRLFRFP